MVSTLCTRVYMCVLYVYYMCTCVYNMSVRVRACVCECVHIYTDIQMYTVWGTRLTG